MFLDYAMKLYKIAEDSEDYSKDNKITLEFTKAYTFSFINFTESESMSSVNKLVATMGRH